MPETVVPVLERRLKAQLLGEVQFDAFTRGRYATDASHYQITPIGVVAPSSLKEVEYAANVPNPKFAPFCGTLVCELRNRRTLVR